MMPKPNSILGNTLQEKVRAFRGEPKRRPKVKLNNKYPQSFFNEAAKKMCKNLNEEEMKVLRGGSK